MNRKQKSFHRRAKLLVDFMERNDLEMEDLERGAHLLRGIRDVRKTPISKKPIKLGDIGVAAQPFFHCWNEDFPPYACTHDSNFQGLGELTASKFRD